MIDLPWIDIDEHCAHSGHFGTVRRYAAESADEYARMFIDGVHCPGCGTAFGLPIRAITPHDPNKPVFSTSNFRVAVDGVTVVYPDDVTVGPFPEHTRHFHVVDTAAVDHVEDGVVWAAINDAWDDRQVAGLYRNLGDALRSLPKVRWVDIDGDTIHGEDVDEYDRYYVERYGLR